MDEFRAATNDYFDNRLVGRLFFRLINFIDKKKHYSIFCSMSFKHTECYENIQGLNDNNNIFRLLFFFDRFLKYLFSLLGICQKKIII